VSGLAYFGIHFLLVLVLKEHLQGTVEQWNIVEGSYSLCLEKWSLRAERLEVYI
jgi:hypothetical protein